METTVRDPGGTTGSKSVKVYTRDLFLKDGGPKVTWTSPGVALLVSTMIFGKSAHTHLNLVPARLFERIKHILQLQAPLLFISSRSNNNPLEDIIVN